MVCPPMDLSNTAFVISYKYDLLGYYTVLRTSSAYRFTLVKHLTPQIKDQIVNIPLKEIMGAGDFDGVTPEKITLE